MWVCNHLFTQVIYHQNLYAMSVKKSVVMKNIFQTGDAAGANGLFMESVNQIWQTCVILDIIETSLFPQTV